MNDPYASWSRTLLDRFFGLHMAGQRARLVVTKTLLDQDCPHLGGNAGFLEVVKRGPRFLQEPRFGAESFHSHAQRLFFLWKNPADRPAECFSLPDDAPLYLPHLAALCLGWTVGSDEDELAPNAYYQRLATILPDHGMNWEQLGEWRKLWDGLESWTAKLEGRRGSFEVEILGHYSNVGIPLSQVVLTQSKIANLPELFVTTGLATRWGNVDAESLRMALVYEEARSRAALGGMLFREIQDERSKIGRVVVERLLEFLADPVFREWRPRFHGIGTDSGSTEQDHQKSSVRVVLVLEATDAPAGWRCRFGVLGCDPPDAPSGSIRWSFHKVDERFGGLWLAHNEHSGDQPIDAGDWVKALADGLSIDYKPAAGLDDQATVLRLPPRRIRIFQETGWIGQRLVEEDGLPTSGGCFIFITSSAGAAVDNWLSAFKERGGIISDYTRSGLPLGSQLLHLSGLERVEDRVLQNFPERSVSRKQTTSCIYLRGGSQVQGTGRQNVYLPYDPPDVVLLAPPHVMLRSEGAAVVEDMALGALWKIPKGLPGLEPRQFRLEISPDASQVRLSAVSEEYEWSAQSTTFAVGRETTLGADFSEDAAVRFDQFGARTGGHGIVGGLIDAASSRDRISSREWSFDDRQLELGAPAVSGDAEHPAWCLCESLAQSKRITAQEFRRRCERILNWWPRYAWSEARWLRALCHVEVERDNRGRIAYVHPVAAHAYLLPWKNSGRWLAVLAGCPTRMALCNLLEAATQLSVEVRVMQRSSALTPPRWLLCSRDFTAIELTLAEAGVSLAAEYSNPLPLSAMLAQWAASMDEWSTTLQWLDGAPPAGDNVFDPRRFQMSPHNSFNCPYKLITIIDTLNDRHRWYLLHDNGALREGPRYAFLLDPSWGKWLSMSKVASEFPVFSDDEEAAAPLPFEVSDWRLHVPASLVFPSMLSRALLTSSGLVPGTLNSGSPYYSNDYVWFTPRDEPPYTGACHVYSDLHPLVAQTVCGKLEARLFEVSLGS